MNFQDLLDELSTCRARVWAEDGQLRLRFPKGQLTPEVRASLQTHKTALIETVQRKQLDHISDDLAAIEADGDARYEPFPLTDIQQAYWIGRKDAFELGAVTCHLYMEIESEHVTPARLEQAWQKLCERHDMLRAFVQEDGNQRILAETPAYRIEVTDLRGLPQQDVDAGLSQIRATMSHQVIPAERWPLFDIRLTHHGKDLRRIHLSIDLLMVDVGSILQLFEEWQLLYRVPDTALPPFEFSFRDYVLAEKAREKTQVFQRDWAYWLARIDTIPAGPKLPLKINPKSLTKIIFKRRQTTMEPATWQALKETAQSLGLTPSGLLLTAFAEILATWSQNQHFTINLTLFNRLPFHRDVDRMVGDFTTLTLLEIDHRNTSNFTERAAALKMRLWQDLEHRSVSGVKILREMSRRQTGRTVLMPVVFTSALALSSSNLPVAGLHEFGERIYTATQTPQVWLDHQVFEEAGSLSLSWDTVDALFPDGMIDQMFTAYEALIRSLAVDESAWQKDVQPLIPAVERQLRAEVNATDFEFADEDLTAGLRRFYRETPDAVAIFSQARTLTYAELWREANNLAHLLRQWGCEPDQLVAVVMEKGWEQVVAIYAILLAGSAYLPMDPEQPISRLNQLLEDGAVHIALVQKRWQDRLALDQSYRMVAVDDLSIQQTQPIAIQHQSHHLAYVIYTSGSTGKPKGVVIDHRGAVNTIQDINRRFKVSADDRALALSALNFDLSVYDVFGLHFAGGALVIPPLAESKEPQAWLRLVERFEVSIWNTVPALMQMFAEHLDGSNLQLPASLRLVMMSGDWIPVHLPDLIRRLAKQPPAIISLGGATEASIWSIFYPIEEVDPAWKSIPYGKPLANQSFHVLDQAFHPRPIGVTGELFIGGLGLAKGYWADLEKTQARFVTNPHTGERLYLTGDLGRYQADGNIEFLGRLDSQVKVGGYRIELGEIEAALGAIPQVKDAAVIAFGPRTNKQLAGYIVPHEKENAVVNLQPTDLESRPVIASGFLQASQARLKFKFEQHGLRKFSDDAEWVALASGTLSEDAKQAYFWRQSQREFLDEPLSFEAFSQFLSCLQQLRVDGSPLPKYRYGSAGHLYPVQTYVYLRQDAVTGLACGFYYYNPENHGLVHLNGSDELGPDIHQKVNRAIFENGRFSIFLVGQLKAIQPVYGPLARDFCLLEAGYMGQLLMAQAAEYHMGICPIGVVRFEDLRAGFALNDPENQCLLHSFIGGGIDPLKRHSWSMPTVKSTVKSSPGLAIKQALAEMLPAYMIPQHITFLEGMPLSANAKVDRKQLPLPGETRATQVFREPEGATEKSLAAIWRRVLEIEKIGRDDDFFELGGHSLLATRAVSRVRDEFGFELPLRTFFLKPKLTLLAALIDERNQSESANLILTRMETGNAPVLSYAQQRLFFMDYLNPSSPQFNMAYAIQLLGPLDREKLEFGLKTLVDRHEPLRTNYRLEKGVPVQMIGDGVGFKIDFEDLTRLNPDASQAMVRQSFAQMADQSFQLETDNLFRLKLLKLDDQHHVLLISLHHLNADGWSVGIILRELAALYAGGSPKLLPRLNIRYRDFAHCQRSWFESGAMANLDAYWRPKLADPTELKLIQVKPNPAYKPHEGAYCTIRLTPAQVAGLEQLGSQHEATIFMVLLAVFKTLLFKQTDQRDLLLGTDAANRNRTELEGLVGFFINILALRTHIDGSPTFIQFLKSVRETVIDAYAHEDMPYDRLVKILDLKRDLSGAPLISALFVHQSFPLGDVILKDLEWRLLEEEVSHARFDLAVFASGSDILGGEDDSSLQLKFLYRKCLFEADDIAAFANRFRYLVTQILNRPEETLDRYSLDDPDVLAREKVAQLHSKAKKASRLKKARRRHARVADTAPIKEPKRGGDVTHD